MTLVVTAQCFLESIFFSHLSYTNIFHFQSDCRLRTFVHIQAARIRPTFVLTSAPKIGKCSIPYVLGLFNRMFHFLNYLTEFSAAREHFGETSTLELSFPRLIFAMRYQKLSP